MVNWNSNKIDNLLDLQKKRCQEYNCKLSINQPFKSTNNNKYACTSAIKSKNINIDENSYLLRFNMHRQF